MKILFASSSSGSRGGGEMYLVYLGRALADRGHEMLLWTSIHPRMDEVVRSFSEFGAVTRSSYRNTYDRAGRSLAAFLDRGAARKASSEWQSLTPDIVHINKQNLEDGLDLIRAANGLPIPTICTVHLTQTARFLGARMAPIRDAIARRALSGYRGKIVTVLKAREMDLASFLGSSAGLATIVTGIPLFDLSTRAILRVAKRAELGLREADILVVGVGRMVAQKRPQLFLAIAAEAQKRQESIQFLWIGDGPLTPEWNRLVEERKLGATVRNLGWQSGIAPYLAAADVYLHVAQYEGLPLALLEAMSAALPCAITGNMSAEMPFLSEANPFVLNEAKPRLPARIDRNDLRARGAASRALIERQFSFDRMAEEYESIYRRSIDAFRSP